MHSMPCVVEQIYIKSYNTRGIQDHKKLSKGSDKFISDIHNPISNEFPV